MNIPLANRLQKRAQRDVAFLQDILIKIIYNIDNSAQIHGGTAIWRCFGGRRFSKNIDIYLKSEEKMLELKEKIKETTERYGAKLIKFKDTQNLIFAEFLLNDIYSEIGINYKKYYEDSTIRNYENLDGSHYEVITPKPKDLILEKIDAYNDRKFITDLYDLRILIDFVEPKDIKKELVLFLSEIKKHNDLEEEKILKSLIYEGPIPSFKTLVDYLKGKVL